jgi:hypothetical protein
MATFTGKKPRAPGEGQHRGQRHGKALNKLKRIQSKGQVLTREQQERFAKLEKQEEAGPCLNPALNCK